MDVELARLARELLEETNITETEVEVARRRVERDSISDIRRQLDISSYDITSTVNRLVEKNVLLDLNSGLTFSRPLTQIEKTGTEITISELARYILSTDSDLIKSSEIADEISVDEVSFTPKKVGANFSRLRHILDISEEEYEEKLKGPVSSTTYWNLEHLRQNYGGRLNTEIVNADFVDLSNVTKRSDSSGAGRKKGENDLNSENLDSDDFTGLLNGYGYSDILESPEEVFADLEDEYENFSSVGFLKYVNNVLDVSIDEEVQITQIVRNGSGDLWARDSLNSYLVEYNGKESEVVGRYALIREKPSSSFPIREAEVLEIEQVDQAISEFDDVIDPQPG